MSEEMEVAEFQHLDFGTMIEADEAFDTLSWLQGFMSACRTFGMWRDGEQYLGAGNWTVRKIRKEIERFSKEQR